MSRFTPLARRAALLSTALAIVPAVGAVVTHASAGATPSVTVKTLHFDTLVGPQKNTHCDVVGDLYTPSTATKAHPAPAILTTNGFGGSKNDQAPEAMAFAKRGYVVLSYSGLGFGGSGCNIELDDPAWDGAAGSQLVDFLGGGKSAVDGTKVDYVITDKVAHDGKHHAFDPRVGMIGGSYGGQIQFSIAGIDPRIDTIIPIITWNDLSYSLAPNNTSFTKGVSYSTPGVEKVDWTTLFFGVGIEDGLQAGTVQTNKSYTDGCANFDRQACLSKAFMDATGYPDQATLDFARHASVATYMKNIRIPTLLAQGEQDTLFNLQESVATYRALKAQGTPVKLVWQSWGHSHSAPAPGELDMSNPTASYEGQVFSNWFDYYLKGVGQAPSLSFDYFRNWVSYNGIATPAYGHASSYPAAAGTPFYLSGTGDLVTDKSKVTAGTQSFGATPQAPTSYSETSALQDMAPSQMAPLVAPEDDPGTFASFTTPALAADTDVVGVPSVTVNVSSPTAAATQNVGPGGDLVLFAKIYDVAPDGTQTLTNRLISPVRLVNASGVQRIELPGIVHRFAKGHTIRFVLASGDFAYRGNALAQAIQVMTSPTAPGVLTLPIVR